MQHHRCPKSGSHTGWEGSQVAILFIKRVIKTLIEIIINLPCLIHEFIQMQASGKQLDADVIGSV